MGLRVVRHIGVTPATRRRDDFRWDLPVRLDAASAHDTLSPEAPELASDESQTATESTMMTATPMREGKGTVSDLGDDDGDKGAPPQPLSRLVGLLTNDSELDARWGARRQGERIPFCKPLALTRIEIVDSQPESGKGDDVVPVDVEQVF